MRFENWYFWMLASRIQLHMWGFSNAGLFSSSHDTALHLCGDVLRYESCVRIPFPQIMALFPSVLQLREQIAFLNQLYFYRQITLNKIINATLLFLPHFSWAELKDIRFFLWTQKDYFSQILFTNLSKSVLVNEIIIHLTGVTYQEAD